MKFSILGVSYYYKMKINYLKVYINEDESLFEDNKIYELDENKIEPYIDIIFYMKKELKRIILIDITLDEKRILSRINDDSYEVRKIKQEIINRYLNRFK